MFLLTLGPNFDPGFLQSEEPATVAKVVGTSTFLLLCPQVALMDVCFLRAIFHTQIARFQSHCCECRRIEYGGSVRQYRSRPIRSSRICRRPPPHAPSERRMPTNAKNGRSNVTFPIKGASRRIVINENDLILTKYNGFFR